jgi:hypothetical protein
MKNFWLDRKKAREAEVYSNEFAMRRGIITRYGKKKGKK